jgi:hypothetical protein
MGGAGKVAKIILKWNSKLNSMEEGGLHSSGSRWEQVTVSCEVIKVSQGQPKTYGRPGQAKNLTPRKTKILNIFGLEEGWRKLLRTHVQISINCRINSFAC